MSYYRDRYGLEADGVLHLSDGRYALIEVKLGQSKVQEGAEHLNRIETLIRENNDSDSGVKMRLPDLKIVVTGMDYGYVRDDGVAVVPVGCLRNRSDTERRPRTRGFKQFHRPSFPWMGSRLRWYSRSFAVIRDSTHTCARERARGTDGRSAARVSMTGAIKNR